MEAYRQNWGGIGTGLLIVAALTPSTHEITLVDENIDALDFDAGYDLAGITCMTQQAPRAYEIADRLRQRGTLVVLGGIHPTILPQEAAMHADAVVVGEAEDQWQRVLSDARRGTLHRFYRSTSPTDMSRSPIPAYELLRGKPYRIIWVQSSRGCPHDCEFCAASRIFGKKYRHKKVKQVSQEVAAAKSNLGNVRIGFADDNLSTNPSFTMRLLNEISDYNVRYIAQGDISIAEKSNLLETLGRTGCVYVFIGLESLNTNNLQSLDKIGWKARKLKAYSQNIRRIQEYGIGVIGAFIVGLESDTPSVFSEIEAFAYDNYLAGVQVTAATPFPGTRLREKYLQKDRILTSDWATYTLWNVVIRHPLLSAKDIEDGIVSIYKRLYSKQYSDRNREFMKGLLKKRIETQTQLG